MPPPKKRASTLDPEQARSVLLHAVSQAAEPTSIPALASHPQLGSKLPASQVEHLLAPEIESGVLSLWRIAGKKALWNRHPASIARERLLQLSAEAALPGTVLEKQVATQGPVVPTAIIKNVRKQLVAEGLLRDVTSASNKKAKYLINTHRPEPFLISEIIAMLELHGVPQPLERIQSLFSQNAPPSGSETDVHDIAAKILEAMNRIAFAPGTTVTFYRLRQQPELARIPKDVFDRAALLLETERKALLSVHDHAAALPPDQQKDLVTDGLGKFYVSIYTR